MNQSFKYISLVAFLLAVGMLFSVTGCGEKSNGSVATNAGKTLHAEHEEEGEEGDHQEGIHLSPEALKEAGVIVEELAPRSLGSTIELPGTLRPHPEGEGFVGSLVEGRIKEVFADIGDRVTEGSPLCTIESPTVGEAEAAYITAQADLQFVQADLERHKTLVTEGIGSKKEQLELEARLASSSSAVSAAERTLHAYGFNEDDITALQTNQHTGGRVTLRSPISGTITSREARIGMQVAPETDLFHIVDIRRLRVQLDIPEQRIGEASVGQEISVISQNGHRSELKGRIDRIGASIEHETRTITALATIDNFAGILRQGAFVTVRIEQTGDGHQALAVPLDAVFKDEHGDQALFVEIEPGEFVEREIETGARIGGWIEIASGVTAGERVVTQGAFAVKSEAGKSKFGDGHNH